MVLIAQDFQCGADTNIPFFGQSDLLMLVMQFCSVMRTYLKSSLFVPPAISLYEPFPVFAAFWAEVGFTPCLQRRKVCLTSNYNIEHIITTNPLNLSHKSVEIFTTTFQPKKESGNQFVV